MAAPNRWDKNKTCLFLMSSSQRNKHLFPGQYIYIYIYMFFVCFLFSLVTLQRRFAVFQCVILTLLKSLKTTEISIAYSKPSSHINLVSISNMAKKEKRKTKMKVINTPLGPGSSPCLAKLEEPSPQRPDSTQAVFSRHTRRTSNDPHLTIHGATRQDSSLALRRRLLGRSLERVK